MQPATGIVLVLDPSAAPSLVDHLTGRDGRVLAPAGCALELLADRLPRPRELHAIVSWDRAVPLKVERLALAVIAAGGVLRRDLDADGLRHRARVAGHHVVRVRSAADLVAFRRARPTRSRFTASPSHRALSSAA